MTETANPVRQAGPGRVLIAVALLGSLGLGLYTAGSTVYFVRSVGLSATQVGAGLSVAGFAGLLVGLWIGHLADRFGARTVAIGMAVTRIVPLAFAIWTQEFWQFLLIVTVLGVAEAGWIVANEAVIAAVMTGAGRVRVSAYLRAVFNIGLTMGSLLSGIALAIGTRTAYQSLIWSYVVTSAVGAALYLRLPRVAGGVTGSRLPALRALRDRSYVALAQLLCLSQLGDVVLTIGLPLWIVTQTSAPSSMAAWVVAVNTVLVATLQVRVARVGETIDGAIRAQEWAMAAFAAMCVLAGLAAYVSTWTAVVLLVLSVVALTVGEMFGQSARWALRYSLAPADAQGQYGAVFRLGLILPFAIGPVMVTGLTSHWRMGGWLILAAVFLVAITVNRPLIGWARRSRP